MRKIILLLFFVPLISHGAIVFDTAGRSTINTNSLAITVTSTANRIGFVGVGDYTGEDMGPCTLAWNGTSMTKLFSNLTIGSTHSSVFYVTNPTTGNIVVTNCNPTFFNASTYAMTDSAVPLIEATSTNSGAVPYTLTHTTQNANAWTWALFTNDSGNSFSATGDTISRAGDSGGDNPIWIGDYGPKVTPGNVLMGETSNASNARVEAVSFYPYTTSSPPNPTSTNSTTTQSEAINFADFLVDIVGLFIVAGMLLFKRG